MKEVFGRDVADLCTTLSPPEKLELLRGVGRLVGNLHAAGFFQPVRLKDLIREESENRLVMIDRETSKPWPTRFSKQRAVAALARTARRTIRDGHRFGPDSIRSVLLGYTEGVSGKWTIPAGDLRHAVFSRLRKDLA